MSPLHRYVKPVCAYYVPTILRDIGPEMPHVVVLLPEGRAAAFWPTQKEVIFPNLTTLCLQYELAEEAVYCWSRVANYDHIQVDLLLDYEPLRSLSPRLLERALKVAEKHIGTAPLGKPLAEIAFNVIMTAAIYWDGEGVDPADFSLQRATAECIMFGIKNQLIWSAAQGFHLHRAACSDAFQRIYSTLGYCPTLRSHR